MKDSNLIGVIYPLHSHIIQRFLNEDKDIFVKYIPRIPKKKSIFKIVPGLKLYFYESVSRKAIVAEGIIKSIEFLDINQVLHLYKIRLMITEEELFKYSKGRNKKIMVLEIGNIRKLDSLIQIKGRITMVGRYVTKDNIDKLFI